MYGNDLYGQYIYANGSLKPAGGVSLSELDNLGISETVTLSIPLSILANSNLSVSEFVELLIIISGASSSVDSIEITETLSLQVTLTPLMPFVFDSSGHPRWGVKIG